MRLYGRAARRRTAQQWAEHSMSEAWHSMSAGNCSSVQAQSSDATHSAPNTQLFMDIQWAHRSHLVADCQCICSYVLQNFSNNISLKDDLEKRLKGEQINHAHYEDRMQQVRALQSCSCVHLHTVCTLRHR